MLPLLSSALLLSLMLSSPRIRWLLFALPLGLGLARAIDPEEDRGAVEHRHRGSWCISYCLLILSMLLPRRCYPCPLLTVGAELIPAVDPSSKHALVNTPSTSPTQIESGSFKRSRPWPRNKVGRARIQSSTSIALTRYTNKYAMQEQLVRAAMLCRSDSLQAIVPLVCRIRT